jgi:apoptosis-inducing factor 3
MTLQDPELSGPEFSNGVAAADVKDGEPLLGQVKGEAVVLVRRGDQYFAVGANCTHYGGPLAEGIVNGDSIRCPWHHARFDLRTGEALAPALNPLPCYAVECRTDRVYVLGKKPEPTRPTLKTNVESVVIIGGGAAGESAAESLRREGYSGKITMFSADAAEPVDRPNLSKDTLAGTAPEEWIALRPLEFYREQSIDLRLDCAVDNLDVSSRTVHTESGETIRYDALLLATGAEPTRLKVPGTDRPTVHYLRTLADCRAIMARAQPGKAAVVIGASFIGLEVAAALITRGLSVHVVAPDARPLERVMGREIGEFVQRLHEQHGVVFHLGESLQAITPVAVELLNGTQIPYDFVVAGIGVKPRIELAQLAGLKLDRGVLVDEYLETSAPGVYAAGDIARWPDPHTGENIRVEHWVVAQRHGQIAARNILGLREPCRLVPFFWSQHYDVAISYVGHAERWDEAKVSGSLDARSCTVELCSRQKTLATITIGRDRESLEQESLMEAKLA